MTSTAPHRIVGATIRALNRAHGLTRKFDDITDAYQEYWS